MFVFIMRLINSMCVYSLQKLEKICLSSLKCSFFLRRRKVSEIYFCASNSFKMGDNSPSSPSSSSSSSSQLSSDPLSLSSDSLSTSSDSPEEQIMKMDESKVDEIKVKVEPYLKLEDDENEDVYQGLEHGIVSACRNTLYAKFSLMMSAFSEFAV